MDFSSGWSGVPDLTRRFMFLSVAVSAIFLLLVMRLWYLQIIQGESYVRLSEKNRFRYLPVAASRGPVYDRNGVLLVDNRPAFDVAALRQEVEDSDELISAIAGLVDEDPALLAERWREGRRLPAYRPVMLSGDVGRDHMEKVQEQAVSLPGVIVEVKPARLYPFDELAAHLFGHMGEITEAELEKLAPVGYRSGDYIGKSGLERHLEEFLRGDDGQRLLEVDVKGKDLRQTILREPLPGNKVYLTLQHELQRAGEEAFGDQAGAAVALDVHSGEILAMISRPAFSPGLFSRGIRNDQWQQLLENERHPLQYRTIRGQYPPGSTRKIVTVLAALQAGVVTPETTVNCTGKVAVGNREFRCWKKRGHGKTDLKKALRESCDVWFYQASLELGIDKLSEMAFAFGLGAPVGFPLGDDKGGLIPTRDWKRRQLHDAWYDGETVIAAIGQGYVLTTPLQLAVMTAAVANGGTVYRPQVVNRVEDWQGNVLREQQREVLNRVTLPDEVLAPVRAGLEAVVHEPHGTGGRCRLPGIRVAGKTGTAQVIRMKDDEEETTDGSKPYKHRDHALFVAYAPADAPEIAVAVVVEHGEHGSSAAAPVAREILAAYFGAQQASDADLPAAEGD